MRFWHGSAIVPLLVAESSSVVVMGEFELDPEMVAWWATEAECVSALARLEREGSLPAASMTEGLGRLGALARAWREVQPLTAVRETAIRLLRVHPLRTADALQLASAIVAAEGHPATLPLVTLDERLAQAAEREGFLIVRPDEARSTPASSSGRREPLLIAGVLAPEASPRRGDHLRVALAAEPVAVEVVVGFPRRRPPLLTYAIYGTRLVPWTRRPST